jgi:hypothetical protein
MKQVSVVKDHNGRVVATFERSAAGGAQLRPVLKPGETVHEVEAKDDYLSNIAGFVEQHSN